MHISRRNLGYRIVTGLLVATMGASVANAASAGTTASGPRNTRFDNVPAAAVRSRLPLTSVDVVPVGGARAPSAAPEGRPGSSTLGVEPQAVGSAAERWPYSTTRVAVTGLGVSNAKALTPVSSTPFRQTGKLYMRFGRSWFVCTASLIKPGVLITAAHCVHNFGKRNAGFADQVRWIPANFQGSGIPPTGAGGPFGLFAAKEWRIPTPYWNGTDTCQAGAVGVVCNNDIATVVLNPKNGVHAGDRLGTYGYGWNGFSFVTSPAFGNSFVADISQLGYPSAFDLGFQMQRNNSFGKYIQGTGRNGRVLKNTQLGSALTGGSSGGPWLVNFGTRPAVSAEASLGAVSNSNIVVGTTSWGYTTVGVNVQGASFFGQNFEYPDADYGGFGAGNIGSLVQETCNANPRAC